MKKSIVRTSLALAVAGVLGTSVVAYAVEAPQVQPVPVVKEAVQTAPVVKQEATAPKIDVSATIKPVANENTKPAVTETVKPVVPETAQPVVVPAVANPAAASMDADTTPVVAKDDKKDAKTTKVVKSNKKAQSVPAVKAEKADKAHK